MDPKHIVLGEVQNVLASMRLNCKWSYKQNNKQNESTLLLNFKHVTTVLGVTQDITHLDTLLYLDPFLDVIKSEETSGPITGVALSSVHKFLVCGIVGREKEEKEDKEKEREALQRISDAVTNCRFVATDPDSDEVILMKIMQVLLACLRTPVGFALPEDTIFEMVQTCYRMMMQGQQSELLRMFAESALNDIILLLFTSYLDFRKSTSSLNGPTLDAFSCHKQLYKFLAGMIDPSKPNSEDIRLLGLTLLNCIIELRGPSLIQIPEIKTDLQTLVSKFLIFNLHSHDISIFASTTHLFLNFYLCAKEHIKLQIESFFVTIMSIIADYKGSSYERIEIALESVLEFCRLPFFAADLFVNYDCDLYCTNLLEDLCKCLSKNSFPTNKQQLLSIHTLSLDCLLAITQSLTDRISSPLPSLEREEEMRDRKRNKKLSIESAEIFSKVPMECFEYLRTNNMISEITPITVATYLRNIPRLDKVEVGKFLGKKDTFNTEVLREYLNTFDFRGKSFIVCMRQFLESFHIPGEAPIIARILDLLSQVLFPNIEEKFFGTADVLYLVIYMLLMLNVDLHNPSVKQKMTLEDFVKNCTRIKELSGLPHEFLVEIYHSTRSSKIRIPEEFPNKETSNSEEAFSDLLVRYSKVRSFAKIQSAEFDCDIFMAAKKSVIAAVSVVFEVATEDKILFEALHGFRACAKISAHYKLSDVLDNLVVSLCKASTLLAPPGDYPIYAFGCDRKAQKAALAMFQITREHADTLQEGWRTVVSCISSLHLHDMLSGFDDMKVDFVLSPNGSPLSPRRTHATSQKYNASSLFGPFVLLGAAGWFGGSEIDTEVEPSYEEIAFEETARKTIAGCCIREIITETTKLKPESLVYFVKALILASLRPKDKTHGDRAAVFSLDLLVHVTILNQERIMLFWALVRDHLLSFARPNPPSSSLFEKSVLSIMYLSAHANNSEICEPLLRALQTLSELPPRSIDLFAEKFVIGISRISKNSILQESPQFSQVILELIQFAAKSPKVAVQGLQILCTLVSDKQFLRADNFMACLKTFLVFADPTYPSNLSISSLQSLDYMFSQVLPLLDLSSEPSTSPTLSLKPSQVFAEKAKLRKREETKKNAWSYFWAPVLQVFCELCKDERADVRNHAMGYLQKSLLSSPLDILTPQGWFICFEEVVFPLLNELLKPQEIDSISLEELRLRAAVLLSKLFLQNMHKIIAGDGFEGLWMRILHFVEKYMKADNSELLAEAVPESLKNMLLVMIASSLFSPGIKTDTGEDLWEVSWQIIDSFCPTIKSDVLAKFKLPPSSPPPPSSPLPSSPIPLPSPAPSPPSSPSPLRASPRASPSPPSSPPYPYFFPIHPLPVPLPVSPVPSPSFSPTFLTHAPSLTPSPLPSSPSIHRPPSSSSFIPPPSSFTPPLFSSPSSLLPDTLDSEISSFVPISSPNSK